jgi:hypothetical protein
MCVQYQPGFTFDSCQARPGTHNECHIHDEGQLFPQNEGIIYDKCAPRLGCLVVSGGSTL